MQPLPFNFVLDFGSNMRSGMLLTMGVHPAWAEIVECATTNKWKEVLKKAKERGVNETDTVIYRETHVSLLFFEFLLQKVTKMSNFYFIHAVN